MLRRSLTLALFAAVLGPGLLSADSPRVVTQREVDSLYHWAYSAAFGTGFYQIGEDTVYVIKIEPVIPLGLPGNGGIATRLRLPFTFGVQSLDLGDIGDLISDLRTVTFVPGVDFDIPVKGSWSLKPYIHYGYGVLLRGSESAQIYYYGVNSHLGLPAIGDFEIRMINGLQLFGQIPNHGSSDRFARLLTGFEGTLRMGSLKIQNRPLYLKPHLSYYWYFNGVDFGQILQPPVTIKNEYEIGLAMGVEERISLRFMSFDRIGIAFRGGGDVQAVRVYLSSVFQ